VNAPHIAEALLHGYFDGELSSSGARVVASHLASCTGCAARHAALCALRQAICENAEDRAQRVDFDALFGRIERAIDAGNAGDAIDAGNAGAEPSGVSASGRAQLARPKRRLWVGSTALLAIAAAFLLMLWGELIDFGAVGSQNAEIEQVDFGDHSGTLFKTALADGAYSNVVWINDDIDDLEDDNPYDDPDDSQQVME
jgi:anti-sigma factor RsiW